MSTPTTHVLLDLDGTISDSSLGIVRSLHHAFSACGYSPPSAAAIRAIIGPPFEITLPTLGIDPVDVERVIAAYRDRYEVVGFTENELYAGVIDMFDDLGGAGHVLTLATAKPETTARRIVEHFGLTSRFAAICGATAALGSQRRTKAQVIEHALGELGVDGDDREALASIVMVGDRDHDVEGAQHNSIGCIGVTWGFGSRDELEAAGAVAVVDTPRDVVAAVATTYRAGQR